MAIIKFHGVPIEIKSEVSKNHVLRWLSMPEYYFRVEDVCIRKSRLGSLTLRYNGMMKFARSLSAADNLSKLIKKLDVPSTGDYSTAFYNDDEQLISDGSIAVGLLHTKSSFHVSNIIILDQSAKKGACYLRSQLDIGIPSIDDSGIEKYPIFVLEEDGKEQGKYMLEYNAHDPIMSHIYKM